MPTCLVLLTSKGVWISLKIGADQIGIPFQSHPRQPEKRHKRCAFKVQKNASAKDQSD